MAIRYNQKLNTSINSIIRNYNAKITRLERAAEEFILPEKTSVKELKETAKTRRELDLMLKDLQRFSKRGMEQTVRFASGIEMSKYQEYKLKRNLKIAKAKTTRDIKSFKSTPIKVFGVPQNTPHEYDDAFLNLKAQREQLEKNINDLTPTQLKRLEADIDDVLQSAELEEQYKNNWLDLIDKLSYYGKVDKEQIEEIKKRINKVSASNFTKMWRNEKSIKAIQELYKDVIRNKLNVDEELENDIYDNLTNFYRNLDVILKDYE